VNRAQQESCGFALHAGRSLEVGGAALATRLQTCWRLEPAAAGGSPLCTFLSDPAPRSPKPDFPARSGGFFESGLWRGAAAVDFANFEPGCTLLTRPDANPIELLPWLNVLLPSAGLVPLHASGFSLDDANVVISGFAHSGKTGVLLAAAAEGARVVGDECLWLSTDGRVKGLDLPAELQLRYLDEFPAYRPRLPATAYLRARSYRALGCSLRWVQPRLASKLAKRERVSVAIDQLFEERIGPVSLDHLFLSVPHASDHYRVEEIVAHEAVERLLRILQAEARPIFELYEQYRYLFPGRRNHWIEELDSRLSEQLFACLSSASCYVIRHPYPLSSREMLSAMKRALR
jgi:hypothetical protein